MKSFVLLFSTIMFSISLLGQEKYEKIFSFNEYQKDWAKVYKDGNYGFIDVNGKEVVSSIYEEIFPFGMYKTDWAEVYKDGNFGFIDASGNEVVKPIYDKIIMKDKLTGYNGDHDEEIIEKIIK